jgi:hypothetical protein
VGAVPGQQVGVAEEVPAVPQILVVGVHRRVDGGIAVGPGTGLDVQGRSDEIERRAPVENSAERPL